ncbi:MAG: Ig-like domain-containing protein [Fibrobacteria bacterium]|nr:Ig-like domain-containing protein [Fibrobacteria bacterium]
MKMNSKLCGGAISALIIFLLISCSSDRYLGTEPIGSEDTSGDSTSLVLDSTHLNLDLYASPANILASNTDETTVHATLIDENRNPLEGKIVMFSVSDGFITGRDTTDESGRAQAVFHSVQKNQEITVTGTVVEDGLTRSATTSIKITGLRVSVVPANTDVSVNATVPVYITVTDARDAEVPFAAVSLSGATEAAGITDGSGKLTTTAIRTSEGRIFVRAASLGAVDSASIDFWKTIPGGSEILSDAGSMRIFADPSTIKAGNSDQSLVTVLVYDENNNPVTGRQVRFSANAGVIQAKDTTNENGEATAVFRSIPVNTEAKVVASMTLGDSTVAVSTSLTIEGLTVELIPQVPDAVLDAEVPVTVRITDGSGEPVSDVRVVLTGTADTEGVTTGNGEFATTVTKTEEGRKIITASALGDEDTSHVDFWVTVPENTNNVESIRKMRIYSSRSQLKADNTDQATITVILTNENNNPAAGDQVKFTSNLGIVDEYATVDSSGRATAVLRAAPVNGVCRIDAEAVGRNLSVFTEIIFSGITLKLIPEQTELKVDDDAIITAFLQDGSGNPIGGDEVVFGVSGADAQYENDDADYTVELDPNGQAVVRLSASVAGNVKVWASALNTSDTVTLRYSNTVLVVSAVNQSLQVGGNDSTRITATYKDGAGKAVTGAVVKFASNAGVITIASATTNGSGEASTWLKSADFTGTATIQALASDAVAKTTVDFTAGSARSILLAISPDNIGINGGKAQLTATVKDANGNMVSGQDVNFRIIKGPGGGEYIVKPVVRSQAGIAISELNAGSLPSQYRGTEVEAFIGSTADTSKLTLSGPPHIITVSRPEDDTVVVQDAGNMDPSTFRFNMGAVVQDINGNDVADGTEVHFSAVVTGLAVGGLKFKKWKGLDSPEDLEAVYEAFYWDIPFEDINNNNTFDPGVDLSLDWLVMNTPSIMYDNKLISSRGEDVDGDGVMSWNATEYDYWYDFNNNGVCDVDVGEDDTITVIVAGDTTLVYGDLNNNGRHETSELMVDVNGNDTCDIPANGDFPYAGWDVRLGWMDPIQFTENDFAVVIDVSATTIGGVAETQLTYPRQFSRRLRVTVNAESNGIRDKDGERFILPQIKGQ